MKIHSIKLQNFRSYKSDEFNLGPFTIIRGPNASGKSSLAGAIELAFTGKNEWTDGGGRGVRELCGAGTAPMAVDIVGQKDDLDFSITVGTGGRIFRSPLGEYSGKAIAQFLAANICPPAVLSAVMRASLFSRMSLDERRSLLSSVLLPGPLTIDPEILEKLHSVKVTPSVPANAAAACKVLYDACYAARTEANRAVKTLEAQGTVARPEGKEPGEIKADIAKVTDQIHRKQKELATIKANYQAAVDRAAEIEKKRPEYERQILADAALDNLQKVAGKRESLHALQTKEQMHNNRVSMGRAAVMQMRAMGHKCPTCGGDFDNSQTIAEKEAQIERDLKELETVRIDIRKIGDPEQAAKLVREHKTAVIQLAAMDRDQKELKIPEDGLDTFELEAEIETLQEQERYGTEELHAAAAAWGQYVEAQKITAALKTAQATAKTLDELVEYFSPSGKPAQLAGDRMGPFVESLKRVMDRFGYFVKFAMEPWELKIGQIATGPDDTFGLLDYALLSKSQQFRFAIALQVALAEITGVRLVIVDEADMLDETSRGLLAAELGNAELDQVIILATGEGAVEMPEGVTYHQLKGETCAAGAK